MQHNDKVKASDVVFEDAQETAVVSTGQASSTSAVDRFHPDLNSSALTDIYDQYMKIIYLIDMSGSMSGLMLTETEDETAECKVDAVKKAMTDYVKKRFAKYANAQVAVWGFTDTTQILCHAGSNEEEVLATIDRLVANGCTAIFQAVDNAVYDCKKSPSRLGAHHVILVSDGQDHTAEDVLNLLPKMKELNIMFDFIFIRGRTDTCGYDEVISALKKVCEETGGEYAEVKKSVDFRIQFLKASERKPLPPGRQ